MKISLSNLFVLTAISTIAVASVTGDPLLGMGLGIILLPTVIGLLIATILAKRYANTKPDEQESDDPSQ